MPYCMYLRKSRKDSDHPGQADEDVLARHEMLLWETAKRLGLNVTAIYREVVSGDSIAGRPVMQQLLREVSAGDWDGVLVVEIERLARGDTQDQGMVAKAFQYSGTKIVTPMKVYDPNDEFDEEYFEFGLYMSRRELKTINRRLIRGREASAKQGKYIGGVPPFGYDKQKLPDQKGYTLVPNADADTVRLIYDLYLSSSEMGTGDLATVLNNSGYRTQKNHFWTATNILKILSNPVYMGKIKMGYRPKVKIFEDGIQKVIRPVKAFGEYTLIDGLHNGLISEERWYQAAEKVKSSALVNTPKKYTPQNPFSGLMKCQLCGYAVKRQTNARGGSIYCVTPGCPCQYTDISELELQLIASLGQILSEFQKTESERTVIHHEITTIEQQLTQLKREQERLQRQLDNLFDLLEQGIYDKSTFTSRRTHLEQQLAETEETLAQLTANRDEIQHKQARAAAMIPRIQSVLDTYLYLDSALEKNRMLKTILRRIDYLRPDRDTPPSLTLYLNWED